MLFHARGKIFIVQSYVHEKRGHFLKEVIWCDKSKPCLVIGPLTDDLVSFMGDLDVS